jgi:hypothetical protein
VRAEPSSPGGDFFVLANGELHGIHLSFTARLTVFAFGGAILAQDKHDFWSTEDVSSGTLALSVAARVPHEGGAGTAGAPVPPEPRIGLSVLSASGSGYGTVSNITRRGGDRASRRPVGSRALLPGIQKVGVFAVQLVELGLMLGDRLAARRPRTRTRTRTRRAKQTQGVTKPFIDFLTFLSRSVTRSPRATADEQVHSRAIPEPCSRTRTRRQYVVLPPTRRARRVDAADATVRPSDPGFGHAQRESDHVRNDALGGGFEARLTRIEAAVTSRLGVDLGADPRERSRTPRRLRDRYG